MYSKIYEILEAFLGKSKQGYYSKDTFQYQFPCPRCIEEKGEREASKFNLEINLSKMVYKCWSCSSVDDLMQGKLIHLVKKYGTLPMYKSFVEELESLAKSKLYEFDSGDTANVDFRVKTITLPQTFRKINISECNNTTLLNYLNSRKITQDIIDRFNIGYTTYNEPNWMYKNRIIIPSYDSYGVLNYWVGRDFTGKSKIKYRNCDGNKKNIVFQESCVDFDSDIILCEGAIDCLYPPNSIALLGKVLTKDASIYTTLMKKSNGNVIICLDGDTLEKETKKIYRLLDNGRLKGHVFYIRMEKYKDIGELYEKEGKIGIIGLLRSAKKYNELDLMFE